MGKLIDSSVLIACERGQLDLATALADHPEDAFSMSAITASELLHGVHRTSGAKRAATEAFVEGLLEILAVLPFDLRSARVHARLWADARAKGQDVGKHDLLIAATALAHGHDLVTRDLRSFPSIPGLAVHHW